jgi:DNA-binding transcriptional LysR family regulator
MLAEDLKSTRPNISVRAVRAALAVRRLGTATRAAEALGLTQSAVSRLVSQIEEELQFRLFDRQRNRLAVTAMGEFFLRDAERMIGSLRRLGELGADLRALRAGVVRILSIPSIAHALLPSAVAAFRDRHPDVRIDIQVISRRELSAGPDFSSYDFGATSLPVSAEDIELAPLGNASALCLLPRRHRLARKPVITADDLSKEAIISAGEGTLLSQRTAEVLGRAGLMRPVAVIADTPQLLWQLVTAGVGIAIVHALPQGPVGRDVVLRRFAPAIPFRFAFVLPRGRTPSPLAELLMTAIRREFDRTVEAAIRKTRGRGA